MLRSHGSLGHGLSVLWTIALSTSGTRRGLQEWTRCASTKTKPIEHNVAESKKSGKQAIATCEDTALTDGHDGPPRKKRGRPRKTPLAEDAAANDSTRTASVAPATRRQPNKKDDIPPRLTSLASTNHNSLASYLRYTRQNHICTNSSVYRGTHYEYTCIKTLQTKTYNFELFRTGRANDLGVDLVGWWKLPSADGDKEVKENAEDSTPEERAKIARKRKGTRYRRLKVFCQCKRTSRCEPAMIRELEGAYAGAPAGWNQPSVTSTDPDPVLALLLTTSPATKGVIAALQRSRWPMGLVQINVEGVVEQFLWNSVAEKMEGGLEGMGAVVRYADPSGNKQGAKGKKEGEAKAGEEGRVVQSVRLSWKGRLWRA